MNNYPENDYRTYLEHHGILGMKWGVKNGPPYPLGASDHSASEKKAGWRDSLKDDNKVASTFSANRMLKKAGFEYLNSYNKINIYSYGNGNSAEFFLLHNRGKDTFKDIKEKIADVNSLSKRRAEIERNTRNHDRQRLIDIYGKEKAGRIVNKKEWDNIAPRIYAMESEKPGLVNIYASYNYGDREDRHVFMESIYDLKKRKTASNGTLVID